MNLIGGSFAPSVKDQINLRQQYHGSVSGNDADFIRNKNQYLYNKNPMVKLISSVNITSDKLKQLGFDTADQTRLAGNGLANEFVLFAGTSTYNINWTPGFGTTTNNQNKSGSDQFTLRSGLNKSQGNTNLGSSAYGLGGNEFGQVPMPGITDVNVTYKNRGSLRTATIKAKAYNRTQLNVIDALYLRLGYTVLLEWGWGTNYLDNETKKTKPYMFRTLANSFLSGSRSAKADTILNNISKARTTFSGNYDAMYARVTNFNWSFNPDGTYDVTINLVSIGDIIESLTINDFVGKGTVLTSEAFQDLIDSVKGQLEYSNARTISINGISVNITVDDIAEETRDIYDNSGNYLARAFTNSPTNNFDESNIIDLITRTTGLVSAVPLQGQNLGILTANAGLNSLTYYLYTQIKLKLDTDGIDAGNHTRYLEDTSQRINNGLSVQRNYTKYAARINWDTNRYYIKLRTLLQFLQDNYVYLNQSTTGSNAISYGPAITFDTEVDKNLMYINKYSVAADYTQVIAENSEFPRLPDEQSNIALTVSGGLDYFQSLNVANGGLLMNTYLECDWLAQIIKSNIDEEGNLSLYTFLTNICTGINASFGNVNNLDITVDEETNQIRFIDDVPIPDALAAFGIDDTPTEFQVYAFSSNSSDVRNLTGSFVKNFSIKTEISNKLASSLAIGAQAVNAVVTANATALQSWNEGLTDRTSPVKQSPNENKDETPTQKYASDITNFIKLLDRYAAKTLTPEELPQLINLNRTWQKYVEARTAEYTQTVSPSGVGFIPINLNLTMDGLSGMKIYECFTINNNFLPLNYPEKLKFLIKKISHRIDSNGWETTIESLSIPKEVNNNIDAQPPLLRGQNLSAANSTPSYTSAASTAPIAPPIVPA